MTWNYYFAIFGLILPSGYSYGRNFPWSLSAYLDGLTDAQVLLIQWRHSPEDFATEKVSLQLFGGKAVSFGNRLQMLLGLFQRVDTPSSAQPSSAMTRRTWKLRVVLVNVGSGSDKEALQNFFRNALQSRYLSAMSGVFGSAGKMVPRLPSFVITHPTIAVFVSWEEESGSFSDMGLFYGVQATLYVGKGGRAGRPDVFRVWVEDYDGKIAEAEPLPPPTSAGGLLGFLEVRDGRNPYELVSRSSCRRGWRPELASTLSSITVRGNNVTLTCVVRVSDELSRWVKVDTPVDRAALPFPSGVRHLWYGRKSMAAVTCSSSSLGRVGDLEVLAPLGWKVWVSVGLSAAAIVLLLCVKSRDDRSRDITRFVFELVSSLWDQDGVSIRAIPSTLQPLVAVWIFLCIILCEGYRSIWTGRTLLPYPPVLAESQTLLAKSHLTFLVHKNSRAKDRLSAIMAMRFDSVIMRHVLQNSLMEGKEFGKNFDYIRQYVACRYSLGKKLSTGEVKVFGLNLPRFSGVSCTEFIAAPPIMPEEESDRLMEAEFKGCLSGDLFEMQDNAFLVSTSEAVDIISKCNGSAVLLNLEDVGYYKAMVSGARSHRNRIPYVSTSDLGYTIGEANYFTTVGGDVLGLLTRRLRLIWENGCLAPMTRSSDLASVYSGKLMTGVTRIRLNETTASIFIYLLLIPLSGSVLVFLAWDLTWTHLNRRCSNVSRDK